MHINLRPPVRQDPLLSIYYDLTSRNDPAAKEWSVGRDSSVGRDTRLSRPAIRCLSRYSILREVHRPVILHGQIDPRHRIEPSGNIFKLLTRTRSKVDALFATRKFHAFNVILKIDLQLDRKNWKLFRLTRCSCRQSRISLQKGS